MIKQHSKKFWVEVNPPQSWPWKQYGTAVVAAVMILKVLDNWRSVLQINIFLKSLNPNLLPLQEMYVTITILEWLVSSWHICLTETLEEKHLKLRDYLKQIQSPLVTLSVLQVLWVLLDPSCKDNLLTGVGCCLFWSEESILPISKFCHSLFHLPNE